MATTKLTHVAGWAVVSVEGAIDISAAPLLRERLIELIATGHRRLVIDMRSVTFLDSTGLGVLVGALKRLRQTDEGAVRVVATHEPVLRVLRMTGLDRVFGPFETVGDAVRAVPPQRSPRGETEGS